MTDTEQTMFNLGVKAGLKAAADLIANRKRCEHDRFESAHTVWDDETAHDALVRRNFAADIIRHLDEVDPDNINDRLLSPPDQRF